MNMQLNKRAFHRLLSGVLVSLLELSGTAFAQVSEVEPIEGVQVVAQQQAQKVEQA